MSVCMNCQEREAVTKRGGYDCCERCADMADTPPSMR